MYNKIYIIGPVGSGKTTFASKLSKKYNIKYHSLDAVAHDNKNGGGTRAPEEAKKILKDIIKDRKWIIEDTGRNVFIEGREAANLIYYIKMSRIKAYYRVTKRLINQIKGKEKSHFPNPKFSLIFYYFSKVNQYYKKEKSLLKDLEKYQTKLRIVTNKDIDEIINSK